MTPKQVTLQLPLPQETSSYRPKSLSSVIDKIIQRIITIRLYMFCTLNSAIPSHQFGFRKTHYTIWHFSTPSAISHSNNKIHSSITINKLCKLLKLGIHPFFVKLVQAFLVNKTSYVKNASWLYSIEADHPQGAIFSPLLFNIYFHDIPTPHHKSSRFQYADDTAILIVKTDLFTCY